jgi:hypothetical protein
MRYILFLIVLVQSLVIQAQEDCDLPECVQTRWEQYDTGCMSGFDCPDTNLHLLHLALASELTSACEGEDILCRNTALLQAVAVFVHHPDLQERYSRIITHDEEFDQVLAAVENGDFEAALTLLNAPPFGSYNLPLVLHTRGLLYELLDRPDAALQEYNAVLKTDDKHLVTFFIRGLLLGRMGRTLEASFDGAWLHDYLTAFAPDVLPLIDPLVIRYPLDKTGVSDWLLYPVMKSTSSPGGEKVWDLTQDEPVPVQLIAYEEVILAIDLSQLRYPRSTGDVVDTYPLWKTEAGVYTHEFEAYFEHHGSLTLQPSNNIFWGGERATSGEGGTDFKFILVPAGMADPRSGFGERVCEGGVISRLRPGMPVHDLYTDGVYYAETPGGKFDPSIYFDTGYRGDEIGEIRIIHVTENHLCIGSELWWEIADEHGNTGWRSENTGNEYTLSSYYGREFFYCPDSPTTRLFINSEGRVIPGLGANNLRAAPGQESAHVGQLKSDERFRVIEGPVCVESMAWWKIESGTLTGWTAEGAGETYWLEPIYPE